MTDNHIICDYECTVGYRKFIHNLSSARNFLLLSAIISLSSMPKTEGSKAISPHLHALICQKRADGVPVTQIAESLNIDCSTIYKIDKCYQERGHHDDAPRSGRPYKLDGQTLQHVKISLGHNRQQPLSTVTSFVNEVAASPVHSNTVRKAVQQYLGLHEHIAAAKPFLKTTHWALCLAWAHAHHGWDVEDWKHVLWTDESSVEIGENSRVPWVWRRPGERYLDKCLQPTFKSGCQSIMVWGCIAHGKCGPLICIPKDQRKGVDYVRLVLSGPLWDTYKSLFEELGSQKLLHFPPNGGSPSPSTITRP